MPTGRIGAFYPASLAGHDDSPGCDGVDGIRRPGGAREWISLACGDGCDPPLPNRTPKIVIPNHQECQYQLTYACVRARTAVVKVAECLVTLTYVESNAVTYCNIVCCVK